MSVRNWTNKDRKQIPVPPITFRALCAYRESLQREMPPGVQVSLHAAVHHAVSLAASMRNLQLEANDGTA